MAQIRHGQLLGDKDPATIGQVVKVVNESPPFKPGDLAHACFPGFMAGSGSIEEWKRRQETVLEEFDKRMQILHACNLVWRKVSKDSKTGVLRIGYYRSDDRLPIPELSPALLLVHFKDIQPEGDKRFVDHYVRDGVFSKR
jgi:hypothetical protein